MRKRIQATINIWLPYAVVFAVAVVSASTWRRALGGDTIGYASYGEVARYGFLLGTDNYYFAYPVLLRLLWVLGMPKTIFSLHLLPWLAAILAPIFLMLAVVSLTGKRWVGCFAGLVAVVFPLQIFVVNVPLTESLFLCGLSFCLWMMSVALKRPRVLLSLLPIEAFLILVRYDSVLLAPFLVVYIWVAGRSAGVSIGRRVVMVGVSGVLALVVLTPVLISNVMRNTQTANASVDRDTYEQIMTELPHAWAQHAQAVSNGLIHVDVKPVREWYQATFPESSPDLVNAIRLADKRMKGTASHVAVPMRKVLPVEKVLGWARVISIQLGQGPRAWSEWVGKVYRQASGVLAPLVLLTLVAVSAGYGCLAFVGIVTGVRRRQGMVIIITLYVLVYMAVALLMIRGNASRHLARVVPALTVLMAVGLQRVVGDFMPPGKKCVVLVALGALLVGSGAVSGAYVAARTDQAWVTFSEIYRAKVPWNSLYDKSSLFCRNMYLLEEITGTDRREFTQWPIEPDSEVWIDFYNDRLPEGVTLHGWSLERPPLSGSGEFGLYQGSWPVVCTFRCSVPHPVESVMLSTVLYAGNRKQLWEADELAIDVSFDRGMTWQAATLPDVAWRNTQIMTTVRSEKASQQPAPEVWVRLRLQVCAIFSLQHSDDAIRFYGEELEGGYSQMVLRSHLCLGLLYAAAPPDTGGDQHE